MGSQTLRGNTWTCNIDFDLQRRLYDASLACMAMLGLLCFTFHTFEMTPPPVTRTLTNQPKIWLLVNHEHSSLPFRKEEVSCFGYFWGFLKQ